MRWSRGLSWASCLLLAAPSAVLARRVPEHIARLRASIMAQGDCKVKLAEGFRSSYDDQATSSYCGDLLDSAGVIFQQTKGGKLTNMDIDCDGVQNGIGSDGRCGKSMDTQPQTSFKHLVQGYNIKGVDDLNPYIHSFVVFGNEGRDNWPTFDPSKPGQRAGGKKVEPLSVMAVVCGDKMFYGVWGDENGPDGPQPVVGEAGIGLATACYGRENINGNAGHDQNDVLYLAFTGMDAVPGAQGAKWAAKTFDEFEESLGAIGDALIERLASGGGGGGGDPVPTTTTSSTTATSTSTRRRYRPTKGAGKGRPGRPTTTADPGSSTTTTTTTTQGGSPTSPPIRNNRPAVVPFNNNFLA